VTRSAPSCQGRRQTRRAIRISIENLHSFPFVAEAEARGELQIQGALFDIADGILRVLDRESGRFEPVPLDW
jgi:carbonic anhydrase